MSKAVDVGDSTPAGPGEVLEANTDEIEDEDDSVRKYSYNLSHARINQRKWLLRTTRCSSLTM
jgi:hypothetical protein